MPLDAIVVGAGPNGLAAAIALARAGRSVRVYEAGASVGGAARSAELTTPGSIHDVCSTIHALALASPFLSQLPLREFGLEFAHPNIPFAHPLDDGSAAACRRSVLETADSLPRGDAKAYKALFEPFVERSVDLMDALLGPIGLRHPLLMARFGARAVRSAEGLARSRFRSDAARALLAGAAAHSMVPLDHLATAGYGLGLILTAHAVGWPVARGGSQRVSDALAAYLRSLDGEIVLDARIESLDELPPSRAVLCDITPHQFLRMAGRRLPWLYRWRLERYRYGPGVFKLDWTLSDAVPWRADACRDAGTVHLGGSLDEIVKSENDPWHGRHSETPYVIVVQASRFDHLRAPSGRETLWAYCHVPHGSDVDMTQAIERQIERAAPGFRDCIVARHAMGPAAMERRNPNIIGGDIAGGAADLSQVYTRPMLKLDPYATPLEGVYLCSSSTPPGVGVHGMCGFYAAQSALRWLDKRGSRGRSTCYMVKLLPARVTARVIPPGR
jgi:phytoene dehydrogenase-like protein